MARSAPLSGFSIVRNAIRFDYPVLESLRSLLPLVDELVVAVGRSDDGTLEAVRGLDDPRLIVAETIWDDSLREGGQVLAQQTNFALAKCRHPLAFYLQADEVIHEEDHDLIRTAVDRLAADPAADALSFRFVHFEGTYAYVNPLRYRRQCRVVRNDGRLRSVGDAAGFGRLDGRRLRVRRTRARIFHYGWARAPAALREKTIEFARLYRDDAWVANRLEGLPAEAFGDVDLAFRWTGSHPAVMRERIARADWRLGRDRRPALDTPLLNPRFYVAWLRKLRILR